MPKKEKEKEKEKGKIRWYKTPVQSALLSIVSSSSGNSGVGLFLKKTKTKAKENGIVEIIINTTTRGNYRCRERKSVGSIAHRLGFLRRRQTPYLAQQASPFRYFLSLFSILPSPQQGLFSLYSTLSLSLSLPIYFFSDSCCCCVKFSQLLTPF